MEALMAKDLPRVLLELSFKRSLQRVTILVQNQKVHLPVDCLERDTVAHVPKDLISGIHDIHQKLRGPRLQRLRHRVV